MKKTNDHLQSVQESFQKAVQAIKEAIEKRITYLLTSK
jgi:hypothetical protein